MRIYSKKIFLITTLLLIAVFLVSCNSNENTETSQTITADPNESTLTDLGKFVSVVPKTSDVDYSVGNEIAKQKIIETIANDRGVKIDFEVIELSEDDFTNELNQLLSTNTYIDSITADYDMLATYASLPGLIKPIDSLLSTYGTNIYNTIDESYWEEVKYDSQIYGIPSTPYPEKSMMVTRGDYLYMFTNEEITSYSELIALCNFYKMAGYEYPLAATWDQLLDILACVSNISPEAYTHQSNTNAFIMREQSASYVQYYLKEMKLLYDNGYLHPDLFTATPEQMKAEFMAGRSAIYIAEYDDLFSDREMLKSSFPDAELKVIAPLSTKYTKVPILSGEEKVDTVLMFTESGQHSEALMTYLDWAYTSQLNHTMTELGAYGEQIMYNPALAEYEYINNYSLENKPYNGIYTLGLSTDMIYTKPTYVEFTIDIIARNTLQTDAQNYLGQNEIFYPVTVDLNDTAEDALSQYTQLMRTGAEKYIKGEISIDEYAQYERDARNSGLLTTLAQEIGVSYLYKIGALN